MSAITVPAARRRYPQVSDGPVSVLIGLSGGSTATVARGRYPQQSLARATSGPYVGASVGTTSAPVINRTGARWLQITGPNDVVFGI